MKGYVYTSPFIVEHIQLGREQGLQEGLQEGLSKGLSKGRREGRRKAAVRSLLTVLRVRNIDVPDPLHQRILGEKNVTRLERWLERAATAQTITEVFAEPS
jgi:predicted transposase YdaD